MVLKHLTIKVISRWNCTNVGKEGTNPSMSLHVFIFPFIGKHLHCSNIRMNWIRANSIGASGSLRGPCRNYKMQRLTTKVAHYWITKFRWLICESMIVRHRFWISLVVLLFDFLVLWSRLAVEVTMYVGAFLFYCQ